LSGEGSIGSSEWPAVSPPLEELKQAAREGASFGEEEKGCEYEGGREGGREGGKGVVSMI